MRMCSRVVGRVAQQTEKKTLCKVFYVRSYKILYKKFYVRIYVNGVILWDVTSYSSVEVHRRFGGTYCLHPHRRRYAEQAAS
jgi:hypothetical protein